MDENHSNYIKNGRAFEDGNRVRIIQAQYPVDNEPEHGDDPRHCDEAAIRSETVLRLIQLIIPDGASLKEAGRNAVMVRHVCNPVDTQSELAAKMSVSQGRISQLINNFKTDLANVFS